jgi:hypothetical protein
MYARSPPLPKAGVYILLWKPYVPFSLLQIVQNLQSHVIITISHWSSGLPHMLPVIRDPGSNPLGGTFGKPWFSCWRCLATIQYLWASKATPISGPTYLTFLALHKFASLSLLPFYFFLLFLAFLNCLSGEIVVLWKILNHEGYDLVTAKGKCRSY